MTEFAAVIDSPIGHIGIETDDSAVTGIHFLGKRQRLKDADSPLARQAVREIKAYFRDPNTPWSIPVRYTGSDHQQKVWRSLKRIPAGKVRAYGDVARQCQSSPRAVGGACRQNPLPLIVPCHRVVAARGLGGFAGKSTGFTIQIKQWLLQHEGVSLNG